MLDRSRSLVALGAFAAASLFAADSVKVRSGDTLGELALDNDVSVADLVAWNDLDDPDRIIEGTTLLVVAPGASSTGGSTASSAGSYVVKSGDTLGGIAARHGTRVSEIARLNSISNPDRIRVGQTLRLSEGSSGGPAPSGSPDGSDPTHRVVAGDTTSAIAARHGVSVASLAAANGLHNPNLIRIGQELTIPSGGAAAPAAPTPPPAPAPAPTPAPAPAPPTPTPTAPPAAGSQRPLTPIFKQWASAYGVPQPVLEAIAWKESDWQSGKVGSDGRLGITQLTPATVTLVEQQLLGLDLDPLDPSAGIQLGARYLRYLLDRTGDERRAVAAWRDGLESVLANGPSAAGGAYADAVLAISASRS